MLIDPLPLSEHDLAHLHELGGAAFIVITNSAHLRAGEALKKLTSAQLLGPAGEREKLPCDRSLTDGESIVPGLVDQSTAAVDPRGNVAATTQDYKTSAERIFTCGDMRRGQSLVVWAIREGRQCARAVDEFLMTTSNLPR